MPASADSSINRSRVIERICRRHPQLSSRDVHDAVNLILERMAQALVDHDRVELRGFGTFSLRKRQPRMARNPRTGQSVVVGTRYVPHFKPGKRLRQKLAKQGE